VTSIVTVCQSASISPELIDLCHVRFNACFLLAMAAARSPSSSSDGVAICYVLPDLWMTSYFHTVGHTGHIDPYRLAASDVIASMCAGYSTVIACVVLVATAGATGGGLHREWSLQRTIGLPRSELRLLVQHKLPRGFT